MFKKDIRAKAEENQIPQQIQIVEKIIIDQQVDRITKKYEFPASFKKAQIHKKALKFGYNAPKVQKQIMDDHLHKSRISYQLPKICPCCNQPINTKNIDICYPTTDLNENQEKGSFLLNSSTSMFFSFIKMAILYLFLLFMLCGFFNLITSLDGNYCLRIGSVNPSKSCSSGFFEKISSYNLHRDVTKRYLIKIQNVLCLVTVLLSIVYFILYRRLQYKIYQLIDKEHQTQDDYSIFVQNIPIVDFQNDSNNQYGEDSVNYEAKLMDIFQTEIKQWLRWVQEAPEHQSGTVEHDLINYTIFKNTSISQLLSKNIIKTISLCFSLGQLEKVNIQRQKLMEQHIQLCKKNNGQTIQSKQIYDRVKALNRIQLSLCQRYADSDQPEFNITHFTGKAFISFQLQHYKEYIMQKYEDRTNRPKYGNQTLTLSRASHPTDINWINMQLSDGQRAQKVFVSYAIITMILVFSAGAILGIDLMKMKVQSNSVREESGVKLANYGWSILASIMATLINKAISYVISQLSEFQRHTTYTHKFISQIIKTLAAQFINTAFIFYLLQLVKHRPYLSSSGLVVQVSLLITVSGFISIVWDAMNVPSLLRSLKLLYKYGYSSCNRKQEVLTYQVKLNKDFQLPVFDIAGRYSDYLLLVYTCLFYCYLVPVGVLATVVIISIKFWIDKIKMFSFSSEFNQIGYYLSRIILKIFEGSLLVFTIGNLIFSTTVYGHREQVDSINIISVVIAFIYVCFISFAPIGVQRKVFSNYQTFQKFSYSDCLKHQKFNQTYWTENPATMFAKQWDINNQDQVIKQNIIQQIYTQNDISDDSISSPNKYQQPNKNQNSNYPTQRF